MASPGRTGLALLQSSELLSQGAPATYSLIVLGVKGRVWVEPQLPPAFSCQDTGDHPAWEGWVWFPTLARLDPEDTNLKGVGREKRCWGNGVVGVSRSRAKGEWLFRWFFSGTEDTPVLVGTVLCKCLEFSSMFR